MNKELENKLDDIINYIKNSKDYQKYELITTKLSTNKEINNLINEIKKLQKQVVKFYSINDLAKAKEVEILIDEKLHLLEDYPIYIEYITVQEELNNQLQGIKSVLDEYFKDITN